MKTVSLIIWALVGIVGSMIFLFLLNTLIFYPRAFIYFPGDPPYVDVIMPVFLILAVITVFMNYGASIFYDDKKYKFVRNGVVILMLINSIGPLVTFGVRFSPLWSEIRNKPASTPEVVGKVYDWESEVPPDVIRYYANLPGFGKVLVSRSRTIKNYIRVDFGGGSNAGFNPLTMYCDYSD